MTQDRYRVTAEFDNDSPVTTSSYADRADAEKWMAYLVHGEHAKAVRIDRLRVVEDRIAEWRRER